MTPESMAQRMDQAARKARESDREQIVAAENRYDHAVRELGRMAALAKTAHEQREWLMWTGSGGVLAGCLLWAIIPGPIARALPESWNMPEKVATRVLGKSSIWEAGVRLLRVGSPEAWRAISAAADMRHQNFEAIANCEKAAAKTKRAVRCSVKVAPPQLSNE